MSIYLIFAMKVIWMLNITNKNLEYICLELLWLKIIIIKKCNHFRSPFWKYRQFTKSTSRYLIDNYRLAMHDLHIWRHRIVVSPWVGITVGRTIKGTNWRGSSVIRRHNSYKVFLSERGCDCYGVCVASITSRSRKAQNFPAAPSEVWIVYKIQGRFDQTR